MKYVLVTGGHGYIGRNIRDYLRREHIIDSLSVDKKRNTYTEDITDGYTFDGIVHLSAISGIPQCEENKEQAYIDNIAATLTVMRTAHEYKIPLVFASSQAAKHPNNSFYAFSKWIGEQEAFRLNRKGANIRVLRFSNVYGGMGWEEKTNVVAKFRQAMEADEPIIVNGEGLQKRDFIHVHDLCKAITLALTYGTSLTNPKLMYPIDIGTGNMVSIIDVAKMFTDHHIEYDKESEWIGVMENVADTTQAKELLGFESSIDISSESIYL